ncbi:discoidin domain-containing protein [Streptomyces sp. ID05-26A]|nr:discoidin domain-containing protein [Streptomyces sp. ID05-26A]
MRPGRHLQLTVNLGTARPITEINSNWLQVRQDYAFLPPNVKYLISNDGDNFSQVSSIYIPAVSAGLQTKTYRAINLKDGAQPKSGRFVKVVVDDGTAWTLLDEIEVRGPA